MAGVDKNFIVKNGLVVNTNLIWANNGAVGINTATPDASLAVVGTANISANVAIGGSTLVGNNLIVGNNVVFGNTLTLTSDATFGGTLELTGHANLQSTANIAANVFIGGNSVILDTPTTLTVGNTTLVRGPTTILADLTVGNTTVYRQAFLNANVNIANTLFVSNSATFYANVTMANTLAVTGNVVFSNTLAVTGNVQFSNTLTVTGNVMIANTLGVNGTLTLLNNNKISNGTVSRFLSEFLVANNDTNYSVTGPAQWRFDTDLRLNGLVRDYANSIGQSPTAGAAGFVLQNDGSGHVVWGTVNTAAIDAPGGAAANQQVIYNVAGKLSSVSTFKFDADTEVLTIPNITTVTGNLYLQGANTLFSSNGNIGIGMNNPSKKFNIFTNIDDEDGLYVRNTNSSSNNVGLINLAVLGTSGLSVGQKKSDSSAFINLIDNSYFTIGSNNVVRMYVSANGNIGLNNTTPGSILSLNGNAYFSNTITIGTATVNTTNYSGTANNSTNVNGKTEDNLNVNNSTTSTILTTTNQGKTGAVSKATLGSASAWSNLPVGYSGMIGVTGTSGNASAIDGHFLKLSNRDTAGGWAGIWIDFNNTDAYWGSTLSSSILPTWNKLLDSSNYNDYAPTKTGTGASGSWGISITGTAENITDYPISQYLGTSNNVTFANVTASVFIDKDNNTYLLNPAGTSVLNVVNCVSINCSSSITATTFIDRDNSAYFVDPASTSNVNIIQCREYKDAIDLNYTVKPSSDSRMNRIKLDTDDWVLQSEDNKQRLYFQSNSQTIYKGGNTTPANTWAHEFRTGDNVYRWLMAGSGDFYAKGNITAYSTSDRSIKENIKPITNALEKINQINGVEFDWKEDYIKSLGVDDPYFIKKHDVGVIAQEIEKVLPEAVATKDDGTKAVRYEKIIALLIEAIKDLNSEINELKKQR